MKPFVIYIEPNKNNKIVLTKEEFEQYIQDAYERGYNDGKQVYSGITTPSPSTPSPITPWYTTPYITCDTHIKGNSESTLNTRPVTLHS